MHKVSIYHKSRLHLEISQLGANYQVILRHEAQCRDALHIFFNQLIGNSSILQGRTEVAQIILLSW